MSPRSNLKVVATSEPEREETLEFKDGDGGGDYEPGCLVMLQSGGPVMTYLGVIPEHDGFHAVCWFIGERLQYGMFPLAALVECEESDD